MTHFHPLSTLDHYHLFSTTSTGYRHILIIGCGPTSTHFRTCSHSHLFSILYSLPPIFTLRFLLVLDWPGTWQDYDFKIGLVYLPGRFGYDLLGANAVYSPDFLAQHTICFPDAEFWHQKVARPSHVDKAAGKWVPDIPEPLRGKHKILNDLMLSQLDCEEHKPIPGDIYRKNQTMRRRVATTLAANMTFNTVNLPTRFPKQLFNQADFSVTHHWKSLFYQTANNLYYHNLFLVLEMFGIKKSQDYVNRSLFTTLNAVNDLLGYMAFGVFSKWNDMVKSNKRTTDGRMIVNNTGMHAIEFIFVFPLTAGSFAERNKVVSILEMMKENTMATLLSIRNAFEMGTTCHIDDNGRLIIPKSSITGTSYHHTYVGELLHANDVVGPPKKKRNSKLQKK